MNSVSSIRLNIVNRKQFFNVVDIQFFERVEDMKQCSMISILLKISIVVRINFDNTSKMVQDEFFIIEVTTDLYLLCCLFTEGGQYESCVVSCEDYVLHTQKGV